MLSWLTSLWSRRPIDEFAVHFRSNFRWKKFSKIVQLTQKNHLQISRGLYGNHFYLRLHFQNPKDDATVNQVVQYNIITAHGGILEWDLESANHCHASNWIRETLKQLFHLKHNEFKFLKSLAVRSSYYCCLPALKITAHFWL